MGWGWVYGLVYWVAILTAFMTAFYTGRAYFMTFWGPEKLPSPDDPEAPQPSPAPGTAATSPRGGPGHEETRKPTATATTRWATSRRRS